MSDYQPHPLRIQRKRTKGFKLPPGAVCVTRPGRWGNPFETAAEFDAAYRMVAASIDVSVCFPVIPWHIDQDFGRMVAIVRGIHMLKGKQLACWCPLDKPCHADILAREANK